MAPGVKYFLVDLGQFADNNIAAIVNFIGAGREGDDLVFLSDLNVRLEGGHGFYRLNVSHELLRLIKVYSISK